MDLENRMTDIREYRKKKENAERKKADDFQKQIAAHRIKTALLTICVVAVIAAVAAGIYAQIKNQVYSTYVTVASEKKQQYSTTTVLAYQDGFITYSKDGISYTDYKGNAMWNQTYEMQSPIVSVRDKWVAVGDYNGHIIYDINLEGNVQEIDTNLPIRQLTVAANGVVAAVLEDSSVTWIKVYNPNAENAISVKTTMQKSGYPMSVSLSDTGKLMQVAYLKAESGSMKSVVSFYNFGEVGQNYTDTMVSSYEYANSVVPFLAFMNGSTAFSVADNRLDIYQGAEIPKSVYQTFLSEEIRDIYYDGSHIGLVFFDTAGEGKYRLDVYDQSGNKVMSKAFGLEYKDIVFSKETVVIYDEAECMIIGLNGREKYAGEITEQTQLLKPLGANRFLSVTKESLDILEMK